MSVATLVVAILGFIGVLFALRQTYLARLRQFEAKYVQRYWAILDGLSLPALSLADRDADEDDKKAIRKYIFLCEDELQMRKNGYISDSTYHEWADGMLSQFKQPMFGKVWKEVRGEWDSKERGSFPYKLLRDLLDHDDIKRGDPNKMLTATRVVRGLAVGRHA
jgi:hypothetical protein